MPRIKVSAKSLPVGMILKIPLLSALALDQAQALAQEGVKRRYRRGELVVSQGLTNNALYLFLDGRAHVYRTDDQGREVILDVLRAGDHTGEMSLIDNLPHSASVRCDQPCDVLILDGAVLARCLPDKPLLSYALLLGLVRRLRGAHRQIASLALFEVPERVTRRLVDLSELNEHGERIIDSKVSRQELAKMVGASREMVSRVMRDMEVQGLIENRPDGSMRLKVDPPN